MSDPLCHRNSIKRRLEEIDDTLENLTRSVQDMSDFSLKAKLEHRITSITLKREKTQALAAVARSQNLLAEMEILIAQNEVNHELEKLKCFKRIKLDKLDEDATRIQNKTQPRVDKSSQTKKSSTKIKGKKSDDNKKKTPKNSPKPTKNNNKSPQFNNPMPVANSSEFKNKTFENRTPPNPNSLFETKNKSNGSELKSKTFENRTPPNSNSPFVTKNKPNGSEFKSKTFENRTSPKSSSLFEVKNKLSSNTNIKVTKMNNDPDKLFKIPFNGQKTDKPETQLANVSRHSLPAVISQPRYRNRPNPPSDNAGSPFRLIYGDEDTIGGGDLFNGTPDASTNDNPHCELVNDFFRELMLNKRIETSSPIKLHTSISSVTTVQLEDLLSS